MNVLWTGRNDVSIRLSTEAFRDPKYILTDFPKGGGGILVNNHIIRHFLVLFAKLWYYLLNFLRRLDEDALKVKTRSDGFLIKKPFPFSWRIEDVSWRCDLTCFTVLAVKLRPRLHEQIKPLLYEQICLRLLHTDQEFEQLKEAFFAHVYAASGFLHYQAEDTSTRSFFFNWVFIG